MRTHFDQANPHYCNMDRRFPGVRLRHSDDPDAVDCRRCLLQRERHPDPDPPEE